MLVAIRCLDEGVNIPTVAKAFILASSANPRQFIQRRGRVLRRAEGKVKAEIYDFVVGPPEMDAAGLGDADVRALTRLVEKEFVRVTEFAGLALNQFQARQRLLPLLKRLRLEHL